MTVLKISVSVMSLIQNEIVFAIPRQKSHGLNTEGKTGEGP